MPSWPPVGWSSSQTSIPIGPGFADQADAETPISASPPVKFAVAFATEPPPLWASREALLSG
jgi:hypothetical protein